MSAVSECLRLMDASPWHAGMTVSDLNRLLVPAMTHNRALLWFDDDFVVTAFMTYAFLDDEAAAGYGNGRLLTEEDFKRPNHDGTTPFIIDFVCPGGGVLEKVREAREFLAESFGVRVWHWYRPAKGWRPGYALARSDGDEPRKV